MRLFEDLAGYAPYWGLTLKSATRPNTSVSLKGPTTFFHVFGVNPILGRTFLPGEDTPGKNNIVVLSYEIWRRAFHGDGNVVGTAVHLDGESYQVIGVMPAGFRFPSASPMLSTSRCTYAPTGWPGGEIIDYSPSDS